MKCSCPPDQTGPIYVRDKDCPEHDLHLLVEALKDMDGMMSFKFPDYEVIARSRASAEAAYERWKTRKS